MGMTWSHALNEIVNLRGVTADEAQKWADEVATCGCEDCGRLYGDEHGFPDLVVSHDVWEQLMPGREGGGLLCPSCMCLRAHRLGIRAEAVFRSGPFCP
jgi:hypothetical protein